MLGAAGLDFPWHPGLTPAPKIDAMNVWMKEYAAEHKDVYVDFHAAMKDARDGLPPNLSHDGVHPTAGRLCGDGSAGGGGDR